MQVLLTLQRKLGSTEAIAIGTASTSSRDMRQSCVNLSASATQGSFMDSSNMFLTR